MHRRSLGALLLIGLLAACHTAPLTGTRLRTTSALRTAQSTTQTAASILPLVPLSPTPLPSGHVSPLPLTAFPSPSAGGSGSTATPVPTVSVGTLTQATVLSNTLDPGSGSIGGIVVDAAHGATPVGGATLTIRNAANATKVATLKNASDGTYQLSGISTGTYYVTAAEQGYTGDAAPLSVTLSIAMPAVVTANLVLVKL